MLANSPLKEPVRYDRLLDDDEIALGYHRDFVGGHWEELGNLQLEFLRARGLQPGQRVLDVGCGCLRGGLPLIRFLEPGHYAGIDRNPSLIKAARLELEVAGLKERRPNLIVNADFRVDLFNQRFDFALAHSLFTHLPLWQIERCLARVAGVLEPGGRFFATYFPVPDDHPGTTVDRVDGIITHDHDDPFHQSFAQYGRLVECLPFKLNNLGAWGHPRGQHMLEFLRV